MPVPHENLAAYQRADDLFIEIHRLTHERFPPSEQDELGARMRRAAFAVPSNIVEGIARDCAGDKLKFLDLSVSSLRELGYGLHTAARLGYIDAETFASFEKKLSYIAAPLYALIKRERGKKFVISA